MKRRLLALCFVFIVALAAAGLLYRELRRPYRGYSGNLVIEIEPGTRTSEVALSLVSRGVLAHRVPFLILHALDLLRRRSVKAGEYVFDRPLTPLEVHRKLVQGDVYLRTVVIPEGSDRFDIARILDQQLGLDPELFLRITEQPSPIRDLDPQAPTLEGYLFPDTYRFPRGASAATVTLAMLARFRRVLSLRLPPDLQQSPARLHEAVTLASLVEKETPAADERPLIAGVFARRLRVRMPLQCDPTVVYAARLSHESGGPFQGRLRPPLQPAGPITHSELALASPYNTYRNAGLPPGPICSPGESSIRAALDPAPGQALYFVSNNHGGHVFASTLAEHQRNVARYRRELALLGDREQVAGDRSGVEPARDAPSGTVSAEPAGKGSAGGQPPDSAVENPVEPATRPNPTRPKGHERRARQKKHHRSHQNQE